MATQDEGVKLGTTRAAGVIIEPDDLLCVTMVGIIAASGSFKSGVDAV
ncbi:MAG: hypothetical protein JRJ62_15685 [Deltaproteobacteria bacterium]|nr:hypothetical protein [Deltaproteobacteria bacterium]